MSSKYGAQFEVPSGFPDVLKDLTREILRHQPEDIYEFSAVYFEKKLSSASPTPVAQSYDASTTEQNNSKQKNDADDESFVDCLTAVLNDGSERWIDAFSLKKAIIGAGNKFGLTEMDLLILYGEIKVNGQGLVDKVSFLSAVSHVGPILDSIREHADNVKAEIDSRGGSDALTLHGLTKSEFTGLFANLFELLDTERSRKLPIEQILESLNTVDIGLTTQEVNALALYVLSQPPSTIRDHLVDYSPLLDADAVWEIVRRLFEFSVIVNGDKMSPHAVQVTLDDLFTTRDTDSTAHLHINDVRELLDEVKFGLSRPQIISLLAFEDVSPEGLIPYAQFSERCALLIPDMLSLEGALAALPSEDDSISEDAAIRFFNVLDELFPEVASSTDAIFMESDRFQATVHQLGSAVELSDRERNALLLAVPRQLNNNGLNGMQPGCEVVNISEWSAVAWPVIKHMRMCSAIYDAIDESSGRLN